MYSPRLALRRGVRTARAIWRPIYTSRSRARRTPPQRNASADYPYAPRGFAIWEPPKIIPTPSARRPVRILRNLSTRSLYSTPPA